MNAMAVQPLGRMTGKPLSESLPNGEPQPPQQPLPEKAGNTCLLSASRYSPNDQEAPPNFLNQLPLFREVGANWLPELTPEEKGLDLRRHRECFLPSLHLRHQNKVWILPTSQPVINRWMVRYDGLRDEIDLIPFSPFSGDLAAPDFASHYETDVFCRAAPEHARLRHGCGLRARLDLSDSLPVSTTG